MNVRAVVAVAAALFASGCVTTTPPPPLTGPVPDSNGNLNAIAFKAPVFGGAGVHDIASDRGNVVLVDVWATWCEPCRDALPLWVDVQKQYAAQGFKVYALNIDEDPNQVTRFVQETKLSLPVLLDPDSNVVGPVLKVNVMPTTFLIDRKGVVRYVHEGFAEEFLQKYQSEIEELLAEKP